MICSKCQFDNPTGNEFCGKCGTKLESQPKTHATVSLSPSAKSKKSYGGLIVILLSIFIFVSIMVSKFGTYFWIGTSSDSSAYIDQKQQKEQANRHIPPNVRVNYDNGAIVIKSDSVTLQADSTLLKGGNAELAFSMMTTILKDAVAHFLIVNCATKDGFHIKSGKSLTIRIDGQKYDFNTTAQLVNNYSSETSLYEMSLSEIKRMSEGEKISFEILGKSKLLGTLVWRCKLRNEDLQSIDDFYTELTKRPDVVEPKAHYVTYVVGGSSGDYNITYQNENGGTSQIQHINNNWQYKFDARPGTFIYLSAQNNNDYGSVRVEIKIDGTLFKTSNSEGAYVIATSNGSVPN